MTVRLLEGHVLDVLASLPEESVHCVVSSPPYYGLRSYGTVPQVWGGAPGCAHDWANEDVAVYGSKGNWQQASNGTALRSGVPQTRHAGDIDSAREKQDGVAQRGHCRLCGAWRGEHGLEPSLDLWLAHEVLIWRAVRRVLRSDGTLWLNIGDAYAGSANGRSAEDTKALGDDDRTFRDKPFDTSRASNLAPKQRMMLPARLALALQADGWWLRDEIIWAKANPMPSSVRDRTTPAHEMLYLLTKQPRYFFDNEAIKEAFSDSSVGRLTQPTLDTQAGGDKQDGYEEGGMNGRSGSRRPNEVVKGLAQRMNNYDENLDVSQRLKSRHEGWQIAKEALGGANKRSVWRIAIEPFPGAHFATFGTKWIEPCIKAGTSERGVCEKCGAPWVRETEYRLEPTAKAVRRGVVHERDRAADPNDQGANRQKDGHVSGWRRADVTLGWSPSCSCGAPTVPATVLDCFSGSGTTALVSATLGRNAIGIELNPEYNRIADARIRAAMLPVSTPAPTQKLDGLPLFGTEAPPHAE